MEQSAEAGMVTINTIGDRIPKEPTKVVNASLNPKAIEKIVEVVYTRCQQVKALYVVSSNGKKADMRIDVVGQTCRPSDHHGARVPHAQIDCFVQTRSIKDKLGKTINKTVPLTGPLRAFELNSADVLAIFENPCSPDIKDDCDLFKEIKKEVFGLKEKFGLRGEFKIEFRGYG